MKQARLKLLDLLNQTIDEATGRPMSGRELSRRTGIRHRSVHDMMANRTKELPLANIAIICEEIGCDVTDLIELVDVEPEEAAK